MVRLDDNFVDSRQKILESLENIHTRDFIRYDCKNIQQIGGLPEYINYSKSDLERIDGAWFICHDDHIAPIENDCIVLSFGVNTDDSFDEEINRLKNCFVYSFDPYIEPNRVSIIRNLTDNNEIEVKINDKWTFFSAGITDSLNETAKNIMTFDGILDFLKIRNKIIDIIKMDIEGNEFNIIDTIDINYLCKYVKQFMLETHPPEPRPPEQPPFTYFKILAKLEKCFSLFYRHTRFFIDGAQINTGWASEWQLPEPFKLDITRFNNETDIATYMFTYGELYFLNENFLL